MSKRRCTSEECILKSDRESKINLDLPVIDILYNPQKQWNYLRKGNIRTASSRKLSVDWKKFNSDEYLFSHCSIISSCEVEDNGYYIKPPSDELVNSNGNAWSTPVLLATFKTFIGKPNYFEHIQLSALSKGTILDAIARPVKYVSRDKKSTANVLYVDILVATNRKHTDIIDRIESGELNSLSMGASAYHVQCSRCGKIFKDDEKSCNHIENELLEHFVDENGISRIVAELCGSSYIDKKTGERIGNPASIEFIEASWVENPAFRGAVVNHFIEDKEKILSKQASNKILDLVIDDIFSLRVADSSSMTAIRVAQDYMRKKRNENIIDNITKLYVL